MSAHPQGQYDEGYGHHPQATDSYYQDDHNQGYYDQGHEYQHGGQGHEYGHQDHGNGGYYDESGYYNADPNNPYQQDGGYYDGHQHGYQDDNYNKEYYNDQYYDQGAPAAGQQPQYGQGGYGFVLLLQPRGLVFIR